jgi:7-carboxy-7-deazaguanine synthase (Cx14CxxC type)
MKRYAVKEMFLTLQGEGHRSGAKSVFLRFAGCNLWSGRPEDRDVGKGACAEWCDTDFFKGELRTAEQILDQADALWPHDEEGRWFVVTGGEPLLQLDSEFIGAAHELGWSIAVETNGTVRLPGFGDEIDWLTISPKIGTELVLHVADELKVVLPGGRENWTDEALEQLEKDVEAIHYFVQPQDPIMKSMVDVTHLKRGTIGTAEEFQANVKRCVDFVMAHPNWQLTMQMHKFAGLR